MELMALLKEWRKVSQELPPKLAVIAEEVQNAVRGILALTPVNVRLIREFEEGLKTASSNLPQQAAAASGDEKQKIESRHQRNTALICLLAALGIFESSPPCLPQKSSP